MYSITVPDSPEALRRAAEFFAGLCGCLVEPRPTPYSDVCKMNEADNSPSIEQVEPPLEEQTKDVDDPATIFSTTATVFQGPTPVVNMVADDQERRSMLTLAEGLKRANNALSAFGKVITPPVELANGIPWDERIHSGSRKTLQSPPHGWKLKKQPAEFVTKEDWLNYVAKVEYELRQTMNVTQFRESMGITPTTTTPTITTDTDDVDTVQPNDAPVPPPLPSTGVPLTYAGLTEKICQAGIQPPQVQQALRDCGLENYPELMKAPELIPQIAQLLGVA